MLSLTDRVSVQKISDENIYGNTVTIACGNLKNPVNIVVENTYPIN